VVNIYSRKYTENDRSKLLTQGLGSGVIVSEKGYIITNYHVVAQADQIVVALQDGRVAAAQLVGKDRRTDIAVLRIEVTNLPVIPTNPNYAPKVGDIVLAIGNPYNLGQTTTFGIISATGRSSISADGRQAFIQTDAAINEGNSGGALVNTRGELVGINTASFQQATELETYGISFAIPYQLANKIMQKIIADGRVIRGYIGIDGRDINSVTSRLLGNDHLGGIVVLGVDPNGPAADAGFEAQDIILKIDGEKVNGRQSVLDIVTELRPGSKVDILILRKGEEMTLSVTVAEDTN
jgi:serine protease DegS